MTNLQQEKKLVLDFLNTIDKTEKKHIAEKISKYTSDDFYMRCIHPFNELQGAHNVANDLWIPIKNSFMPIQRRMDIFYAGTNLIDNHSSKWVVNMGHLLGIFNQPFLGIVPTKKAVMLWYCEFYRVENNKITEGAFFLDILKFMQQLQLPIVPDSTGMVGFNAGPMTHDGLYFNKQPEKEGQKTLDLIRRMANRLVGSGMKTTVSDLEKDWHKDMIWWGPGGIGASYTYDGYLKGQNYFNQISREKSEGVQLVDVEKNKGVKVDD